MEMLRTDRTSRKVFILHALCKEQTTHRNTHYSVVPLACL